MSKLFKICPVFLGRAVHVQNKGDINHLSAGGGMAD
jgi:hypothetical protein